MSAAQVSGTIVHRRSLQYRHHVSQVCAGEIIYTQSQDLLSSSRCEWTIIRVSDGSQNYARISGVILLSHLSSASATARLATPTTAGTDVDDDDDDAAPDDEVTDLRSIAV